MCFRYIETNRFDFYRNYIVRFDSRCDPATSETAIPFESSAASSYPNTFSTDRGQAHQQRSAAVKAPESHALVAEAHLWVRRFAFAAFDWTREKWFNHFVHARHVLHASGRLILRKKGFIVVSMVTSLKWRSRARNDSHAQCSYRTCQRRKHCPSIDPFTYWCAHRLHDPLYRNDDQRIL